MAPDRRLAAILHADVVAYSRLMAEDEDATVRLVTAYREEVELLVYQHRGELVDFTGDNFLAEFGSAVAAVECGIEIQRVLHARNDLQPPDHRMEFRMGIHLGKVRVEGGRLFGTGVNVAARLQALAEPGGIRISGKVRDELGSKLELGYEDLGEQAVKNIPDPVRVYRVSSLEESGAPAPRVGRRRLVGGATALTVAVISGVWLWPPSIDREPSPADGIGEPSIAVLPFENLSGDPADEYFSDGITDTLITQLSKVPGLFVVARTSTFSYKENPPRVDQIGRELGVEYVLEGSVQRAEGRVRINAQIVEAASGGHVWAERYDRELDDIFALQDEIAHRVVLALKVSLTEEERERFRRAPTDNLEAYDYYLRAWASYHRQTPEGFDEAIEHLERAIELDPLYAGAYAFLGGAYILRHNYSPVPGYAEQGLELARKALELDDSQFMAHVSVAAFYYVTDEIEQAVAGYERAIALAPSDPLALMGLGNALTHAGRSEEAIDTLERAVRLQEPAPDPLVLSFLGKAHHFAGQHEKALETLDRAIRRNPDLQWPYVHGAACYVGLGREEEGRRMIAELLRRYPDYTLDQVMATQHYVDPGVERRYYDAIRRAGLPERGATTEPGG